MAKYKAPGTKPKARRKATKASKKLGGMAGKAAKAIRGRRKVMDKY